jgi:RNA polymerase sigma-70 factor, ECF subfamily
MTELADEELVAQYRLAPESPRGRASVEELFARHHARVIAWCYRAIGDRNAAPDLAQDVFAKAYTSLDTFRSDSKFTTWLYAITRNRCLDEVRARAARPRETSHDALADAGPTEANEALAVLDARDARVLVRELVVGVLDPTELQVMTLHYGHDLTLAAVTAVLGLTNPSGAKAYIVSAKRKLGTAIGQWQSGRLTGKKGHG